MTKNAALLFWGDSLYAAGIGPLKPREQVHNSDTFLLFKKLLPLLFEQSLPFYCWLHPLASKRMVPCQGLPHFCHSAPSGSADDSMMMMVL